MPEVMNAKRVVLVLGGTRSGKSRYAEQLAEHWWPRPLYLATAEVFDTEMTERVKQHRQRRGAHWGCVESPVDIATVIRSTDPARDGLLLDCATVWLSNVIFKEGEPELPRRRQELLDALARPASDVIIVSNEVGMGIVPESPLGRHFRDLQGALNQALAAIADTVVFVIAGQPLMLKGTLPVLAAPAPAHA